MVNHQGIATCLADCAQRWNVSNFLASGKVKLPTSYRVLDADGSIPAEGMLNASYRGADLRRRLVAEGIEFDASGRARQDQRLTASTLKTLLSERADETGDEAPATTRRAWMVRGTSVDGFNLVPQWLAEGHASLSATQLGNVDPGISYDDLKQQVEAAYQHKSYAYRGQRLEEFDRFIRRMSEGDLVLTPMQGMVYLGEVASPAYFEKSASVDSNLRRDIRWSNPEDPIDGSELRAPGAGAAAEPGLRGRSHRGLRPACRAVPHGATAKPPVGGRSPSAS